MIVNIIRASRMCLAVNPAAAAMSKSSPKRGENGTEDDDKSTKPARNFHLNLKPVHQFGNGKHNGTKK